MGETTTSTNLKAPEKGHYQDCTPQLLETRPIEKKEEKPAT